MSLCFDIAVGLEALHKHGVVHCDLKPKNILIRRRKGRYSKVSAYGGRRSAAEGAVRALVGDSPFVAVLADFGGSLIFSDTKADTMRPKVWTPFWSAPECYARAAISKKLLPKIDIYAAGLIFAFILLEGRDIFTKVVDRGALHSQDTTISPDGVKQLKLSDSVLNLAKLQVQGFETSRFALYVDGSRAYISRETMYAPPYLDVFDAILETSLHADPQNRVENATDMLNPWKVALRNNFHLANGLDFQESALFRSYRAGTWGSIDYFERAKTCARYGGTCLKMDPL
jgi:serine/threonine protein kinase